MTCYVQFHFFSSLKFFKSAFLISLPTQKQILEQQTLEESLQGLKKRRYFHAKM